MDYNYLREEIVKIKKLGTKEERAVAIDKVMDSIEDYCFKNRQLKDELNELAWVLDGFRKFYEKDISEFNAEFKRLGDEAKELEITHSRMEDQIKDLQLELNRVRINRDYRKFEFHCIQEVAKLFEA